MKNVFDSPAMDNNQTKKKDNGSKNGARMRYVFGLWPCHNVQASKLG